MFNDQNPVFEFRGPWGVPVQFGASFIFIVLFYCAGAQTPRDLGYDLVFVGMLVGSIFLHELGHAWGCLIQGVRVRRIMMHGAGGFCERSVSASRYAQELIVAMGPIVTIALWAISTLAYEGLYAAGMGYNNITWALESVAWINLYLFIFNMLPLQPLDGGKLFELVLHRLMPADWAIKITGITGLIMIAAWLPLMIFGYSFFGMVLLFVPAIGISLSMARHPIRRRAAR